METGARAQVNADAVCALRSRFKCLRWAEQGMISALGSDIHMRGNQYQKLEKADRVLKRYIEDIEKKAEALLWGPEGIPGLVKKEI